jgi:nanoRNase/pAp phosphatase (c-di-AMP/oligoRNAs hydrolase)
MVGHAQWSALYTALAGAKRVLLTGPVGPDGDSLGACLALQRVLARDGVASDVAGLPGYRFDFMPGADTILDDNDVRPVYDAVVVLATATASRLPWLPHSLRRPSGAS